MKSPICLLLLCFSVTALAGGFRTIPMTDTTVTQNFFKQVKHSLVAEESQGQLCALHYPIQPELKAELLAASAENIVRATKQVYSPNEMDFTIYLSRDTDSDLSGIGITIELENNLCKWFTVHYIVSCDEGF